MTSAMASEYFKTAPTPVKALIRACCELQESTPAEMAAQVEIVIAKTNDLTK